MFFEDFAYFYGTHLNGCFRQLSLKKHFEFVFLMAESVKVVPLVSETDTFVYAKVDTPNQKVQ